MLQLSVPASEHWRRLLFCASVAEQRFDSRRGLESRIELEIELRREAQSQCTADLAPNEAACAAKALDGFVCGRAAFQMREKHAAMTQIVTHLDRGQGDAAKPRVLQVPQQHLRQLAQHHFGDPFGPPAFTGVHRYDPNARIHSKY